MKIDGYRVQKILDDSHITQSELSRMMNGRYKRPAINKAIKSGEASFELIASIASTLWVTPEYITGKEEKKTGEKYISLDFLHSQIEQGVSVVPLGTCEDSLARCVISSFDGWLKELEIEHRDKIVIFREEEIQKGGTA